MVTSCSAYGCTNRHTKNKNISFHCFPKNENMRKKWLVAMRRKNFTPSTYAKICSNHFHSYDFVHNFGRKTLKPDVVPSIFAFSKRSIKRPMKLRSNNSVNEASIPSTSGNVADGEHDLSKRNVVTIEEIAAGNNEVLLSTPPKTRTIPRILRRSRPCTRGSVVRNNQNINEVTIEEIAEEKSDIPLSTSSETNKISGKSPSTSGSVVDGNHDISSNMEKVEERAVDTAVFLLRTAPETNILTSESPSTSACVVDGNRGIYRYMKVVEERERAVDTPVVLLCTSPETNILTGKRPSTSASAVDGNRDISSNMEVVEERSVDTPVRLCTSPKINMLTGKRKRSVPAFMGDIEPSDLEKIRKFKIMWHIAKQKIDRQKQTIKYLRTTLRRANQKISTLEDLVYDLFESII